ncbi:MAG: uL15 family ribosomal protein [Nanoarchaeota archaeon]|nr:uL15 family ribosomal protein [Nanoarchaeota archaeon]
MVKVHKRTKNSRLRGSRTAGWGFRQSHKGHGSRGGFGMAGTGKRADHKKQKALMSDKKKKYFGKQGATSRGTARKKNVSINLYDIKDNIFKKEGTTLSVPSERMNKGAKINLSKYKILGSGEGFKAEITARAATALAIEKMTKAGGSIIIVGAGKKDVKQYVKAEKEGNDEESSASEEANN